MSFSESPRGDDVLMMGRIEPEKGFLQVIEAWNSIPMHVKGGRTLHIVGEGSMLDTVKLSSRKKDINLHGILTAAQISDLGAYCGTGIACSLWDEPFGKIAAEYQAMGLKTLVTPRGGLIEIAKKSPGGSVTRDINVVSITNSLIEVLNNNLISRRQIFDSYESNYSVDSVTDKWKQFFEEILYG
jgi:glycosyltransferase involved in cell wall biosynthesis